MIQFQTPLLSHERVLSSNLSDFIILCRLKPACVMILNRPPDLLFWIGVAYGIVSVVLTLAMWWRAS
jgi:hypothetical protein